MNKKLSFCMRIEYLKYFLLFVIWQLLVENEKNETAEPKHAVVVTTVAGPFRRRHPAMNLCVILLGLVLMMALIVGCISLYKHLVSVHEVGPEILVYIYIMNHCLSLVLAVTACIH